MNPVKSVLGMARMGRNLREPWRWEKLRLLAKTYASRALDRPLVKPRSVTLTLTTRCNLACIMCNHWRLRPVVTMPLEDAKRYIDQIAAWGVPLIDLSGGEPFTHPKIYEVIEYASRKGLNINITTNGTLFTRKGIGRIMGSRVTRLQLSIDALDPETHDRIRGQEGAFRRSMRAVAMLDEARKRGSRPLGLNLTTVIQHDNFTRLVEMYRFAKQHGFDSITYQPVNDDNLNIRRVNLRNPCRVPLNRMAELDVQIDQLIALRKEGAPIGNTVQYLGTIKSYFRNEIRHPVKCYAGYVMGVVSPDGKMWSCVGNFADLRRTDIVSAWHSEEAARKRKLIRRCRTPCLYPCYLEGDAGSLGRAIKNTLL